MTKFNLKLAISKYIRFVVVFVSLLLVAIDQLIKYFVFSHFQNIPIKTIPLISDFLHISYVENRGVAFGMMQGGGMILIIVTSLIVLLVAALIFFSKDTNRWYLYSLGLILGGGIGNLIDRIARGFVVDYIDFRGINFAVFNFADCCVTIGTILFMIYIIFVESRAKKAIEPIESKVSMEKISISISEHKNKQTEKVNKYINVVGEICEDNNNPIIMSQDDIKFINKNGLSEGDDHSLDINDIEQISDDVPSTDSDENEAVSQK